MTLHIAQANNSLSLKMGVYDLINQGKRFGYCVDKGVAKTKEQ